MNKGQVQIGSLVVAAIAIIIGLTIFTGSVAPSVGTMTQTQTASNVTYTMPAAGSYVDLVGQEYISGIIVTNASSATQVPATNYSIVEMNSPTTGVKTVRMLSNGGNYTSKAVNVSYVYGPAGYVDDAGGRSVVGIIPLMVALAVLAGALLAVNLKDIFD